MHQVRTQPYGIRESHYVPRIITELEFTLLPGKEVSFSPFHPVIFYTIALSKDNLLLAASGSLYLMLTLTEFSPGFGSFSERKKLSFKI